MNNTNELFDQIQNYPDFSYKERLDNLVGLDDAKNRMTKIISLLINPDGLQVWAKKYHNGADSILNSVLRRPPLVILAGDVGSGKTELAETIGDAIARQEKIDITLFPLSLSSRGQGRVGEMTQLVSAAFDHTLQAAERLKSASGKSRGGIILLIDEADALAQSRESGQMHHEDRAGVNAFIRGIDRIANAKIPAVVIMCTNRLGSLDPAVKRRAADIISFSRPSGEQRLTVLKKPLTQLGFTHSEIISVAKATGPISNRKYGCTFSDLIQRFLPQIVLDAYPSKSVCPKRSLEIAKLIIPTPPFQEDK